MLQVMLGNADGTFGKPITISAVVNPTIASIAVGDVNGDGIPDLVAEGEKAVNGTDDFNITVALGNRDKRLESLSFSQLHAHSKVRRRSGALLETAKQI